MLIGIDPLLGPDALHLLRAMGHGDELVLADANVPAARVAKRLVRLDGIPVLRALEAVLSLLPLDEAEPHPVLGMQPHAPELGAALAEMQSVVDRRAPQGGKIALLERHAFYERATQAFGVIITGERRFYANLILRKGVIPMTGAPA